jgi:hypothetical protein
MFLLGTTPKGASVGITVAGKLQDHSMAVFPTKTFLSGIQITHVLGQSAKPWNLPRPVNPGGKNEA